MYKSQVLVAISEVVAAPVNAICNNSCNASLMTDLTNGDMSKSSCPGWTTEPDPLPGISAAAWWGFCSAGICSRLRCWLQFCSLLGSRFCFAAQCVCRYSASSVKQSACLQHQGPCPRLVAAVNIVVVVCDVLWLLMHSKHIDK